MFPVQYIQLDNIQKCSSFNIYIQSHSHIISGDTSCLRDDEFGRQAVAGINPLSIERLTVFPPVSKLDSSIYGSQESALEEEHLIGHLDGMSVQQVCILYCIQIFRYMRMVQERSHHTKELINPKL